MPNQCGTMCVTTCPMGYSCNAQGECVGGNSTGLVLNVDAVNVSGGISLNGAALVKTCSTSSPATIIFEEINLGYQLSLNAVCDATASFTGTVYPGTYKVSVKGTSFSNLPQGTPYVVHPSLTITSPNNTLPLDVLAVNVNGGVTLNAAALVKTCSTSSPATVKFHEINQGYDLTLNSACDATASFTGTVYPGTYKVSVSGTSFSNLPQGSPYVVHPVLTITNPNNTLPLDVLAVNVNGGVTINAAALVKTCSTSSPATVKFHEVNQGYDLTLNSACDAAAAFNGTVYPGTYKVSVAGTSFSNLPQGSPYVVHPSLALQNASNTLPLDVLAVNVNGGVTLNAAALVKTCSTSSPATVLFHEVNQRYVLKMKSSCDASAALTGTVFTGTFKVSVAGTSFSNLPQGSPYVVHPSVAIQNASNMLPLNVLAVNVNGGVTLNGAALVKTCSTSSPATVLFHEVNQGYDLTLNSACDMAAAFNGTVYPGTYKVSVSGTSFSNLPQGSPYVVHPSLAIQNASNMLPLDVPAVSIAGSITLNDLPPMKTCSTSSPATVIFKEVADGYTLTLAALCNTAFSFSGTVYPGTYDVSVAGTSFSNLPQGSPFLAVEKLVIP